VSEFVIVIRSSAGPTNEYTSDPIDLVEEYGLTPEQARKVMSGEDYGHIETDLMTDAMEGVGFEWWVEEPGDTE
jgi:hypothetical protein